MKLHISIIVAAAVAFAPSALAIDSYTANFDTGIPRAVKCEQIDGGTLNASTYRSGFSTTASWLYGKVSDTSASGAALCPTGNADGSVRISRMTMPAVDITNANALVVWDARSMIYHIPEAYSVKARVGTGEWQTLLEVDAENYFMTTRCVSLADFSGKSVQVAFESATNRDDAFMIAIDNVFIGVPTAPRHTYESITTHYTGESDSPTVSGILTCFGTNPGWTQLRVVDTDNPSIVLGTQSFAMPTPGAPIEVNIPVDATLGTTLNYTLQAVKANGATETLDNDFIAHSHFRRTQFLDRFTGTWCNNCPPEGIVINNYRHRFGDNMIIAEAHYGGNDVLTCSDYSANYMQEFVYSVPQIGINHNRLTVNSANNYQKNFNDELTSANTIAAVTATRTFGINNALTRVIATARFATDIDNSDDRYRIGYLILADVHDPINYAYIQSNSTTSTGGGEFYYQSQNIMPKMLNFSNVIVEASTGVQGAATSLPAHISAFTPMTHTATLQVPTAYRGYPLKVLAMVIDKTDGRILNCSLATDSASSGIDDIVAPATGNDLETNTTIYDLTGRKVRADRLTPGIYISGGKKFIVR